MSARLAQENQRKFLGSAPLPVVSVSPSLRAHTLGLGVWAVREADAAATGEGVVDVHPKTRLLYGSRCEDRVCFRCC